MAGIGLETAGRTELDQCGMVLLLLLLGDPLQQVDVPWKPTTLVQDWQIAYCKVKGMSCLFRLIAEGG